jgi:hypothetical protein
MSEHDKKVKELAQKYKNQGFKVKAAIDGYPSPQNYNGAKPDIRAQKGEKIKLCEVETPASMKTDKDQRRILRKYVQSKKNITFRTVQTKKKK